MTRTKLIATALALLVGGGATLVFFAGNASAQDWHAYTGDLFAGHAYGLLVPKDASVLEVNYHGAPGGSARLTLFDPSGSKVGYYALGDTLGSASLAAPKEGRYVVYVYDLTGALAVRVDSSAAPSDASLQQIPLKRQDIALGVFDRPEKLDKAMTASLVASPVFATLLYDGSAQNLDATIASAKGNVVTITKETATAFEPGVWTSYAGTRTIEPANLDGVAYTATAHADAFQGHLVLTTLAVDFSTPIVTKTPTTPPTPDPTVIGVPGASSSFALGEGKAIAFTANAGKLILAEPKAPKKAANATNESRHSYSGEYFLDQITLYGTDDRVLSVVTLDGRHPTATIELPVSGEYVAFVRQATNQVILASLPAATAAPALRELALANESFTFRAKEIGLPLLPSGAAQEFTLAHVPVGMSLKVNDTNLALLGGARAYNEKGTVATWNDFASVGPLGEGWTRGSGAEPANFRNGLHSFQMSGTMGGTATLVSTYYVRAPVPVVS